MKMLSTKKLALITVLVRHKIKEFILFTQCFYDDHNEVVDFINKH